MEKKWNSFSIRKVKKVNYLKKTFFMMLFLLTFQLKISSENHQESSKLISLNFENEMLSTALKRLEKASEYRLIFNYEDVESYRVKGSFVRKNINDILDALFVDKPLVYSLQAQKKVIIITEKLRNTNKLKTVSGQVLDVNKSPLPGVNVLVAGISHKSLTDENGRYVIQIPENSNVTLFYSFVGMKSEKVRVKASFSGSQLNTVILQEDSKVIDEVVVTGYQTFSKKKLTSSVTSLKAEDIIIPSATSIDQMLEGQVPDLVSITNSGEIGVVPKIRIRGTSTLIGNREPLWVLDGVPLQDPVSIDPEQLNDPDYINNIGNAIAGINPQDIERIDILKDASSTALYGAKAANGVIVVTTKKGSVGKPVFTYNEYTTLRIRPRYSDRSINLMNSHERVDFSRYLAQNHYVFPSSINYVGYEGALNQYYSKQISYSEFSNQVHKFETANTDWFDLLTEDSFSAQHTLSVSGGSDKARYYASLGLTSDKDVVKWNKNNRYSMAINVDVKLSDKSNISFKVNGNSSERNYYQSSIDPINYAYNTSRAIPAYEDNDYYYYQKHSGSYTYNYNVLNELNNSSYNQKGSAFSFQANLNYNPLNFLRLSSIISYSLSNTNIDSEWGEKSYYIATKRKSNYGVEPGSDSECPAGGELTQTNSQNRNYMGRFQADFNKDFGGNLQHNISITMGLEGSSSHYNTTSNTDRGYFPDRGLQFATYPTGIYTNYDKWLVAQKPSITDNISNLISGYFSISYSYMNRLNLNWNARYDGSNKFGNLSNDKMLPVWSASTSYNFADHLKKHTDIFDVFLCKFSYGYQGNMLDGQSPVTIIKKKPIDTYYNEMYSVISTYPNPDLKWERTQSINTGLDISMFKGRIGLNTEFYYKYTKDAFMSKQISGVNGLSSYTVNGGKIINKGYDVTLSVVPVQNKNWRWNLSTSISKYFNKVETTPSGDQYSLDNFLSGTAVVKGQPVSTFYSYKFLGLSPTNGEAVFDDYTDYPERLFSKTKYEVFTSVLTPSGRREPKITGSLNTNLRYKNIRLSGNFYYSLGAKIRLFRLFNGTSTFLPEYNISKDLLKRWQYPGDEKYTNIPAASNEFMSSMHWSGFTNGKVPEIAYYKYDMYNYSDIRVVSADYLKCNNLSLSYLFPEKLIRKINLSRCELSVSGSNLFTLCSSKLKGQTPQQTGFASIQLSNRPSYSLGVNIQF
nr:SusC/RagA family TonB-linked outer membrane protein [uncultured Bacteroides sp.]